MYAQFSLKGHAKNFRRPGETQVDGYSQLQAVAGNFMQAAAAHARGK